jgi:hypothetical protein
MPPGNHIADVVAVLTLEMLFVGRRVLKPSRRNSIMSLFAHDALPNMIH